MSESVDAEENVRMTPGIWDLHGYIHTIAVTKMYFDFLREEGAIGRYRSC
jgi:hypothetical protein